MITVEAMKLSLPPSRVVRFAIVGTSGVVVNLGFVWLGLGLFAAAGPGTRDSLASALGIGASIFSNFLFHDGWTWGDRPKSGGARGWLARLSSFVVVSALAAAVQFGTALALRLAVDANVYLAQTVGIGLGIVLNYGLNNVWTFRTGNR